MSALFAILAGAMLLAPLLGSALVALSGWRLVFVGIGAYGFIVLFAVIKSLPETGNRNADGRRLGQQFSDSTRAFLATPQSLVATAIFAIAFCGFFAFVTNSSTVASDVFGIAPGWFGPLYAAVALSYLLGSTLSRYCVARLGSRTMLRAAASVLAATGVALLAASRPDVVPLTLLWSLVMLYAFAFGIVTPTTTSLALEPLPTVAGFASSIIGTVQSAAGAAMSAVAAWLYAGSTQSLTLLMGCAGVATGAIYLLGRGTLSHGEGKLHG
jgi:DHA1 family bicyclomycin/chloramphenicol resistance-like MFS transporter